MNENRRHTKPVELNVARAPEEIARLESRNGLLQTDKSILIAFDGIERDAEFKIRPSMIMQLHSLAMEGLTSYAGTCRPGAVEIQDSSHVPPDAFQVLQYIEKMCDYINENWTAKTPIHLAAYAMWRMNWIHPFTDGNGRTARAVTFVVLSVAAKCVLTTPPSIPQQFLNR